MSYQTLPTRHSSVPIKMWTEGVAVEEAARRQLENVATLPFIYRWVAVMPDVHLGTGATVGSVIPTKGAIIPAAVGVDIGCGMVATRTTLTAEDLPESLKEMRKNIEKAVPHGRTAHGGRRDEGAWGEPPKHVTKAWRRLEPDFRVLSERYTHLERQNHVNHLGTLGTGNHFIEVCLDEAKQVWFMLHSGSRGIGNAIGRGSRGIGNAIGRHFIELAQKDMHKQLGNLPDKDLAYLQEGSEHFDDYCAAVAWAQDFARINRQVMMEAVVGAVLRTKGIRPFEAGEVAVNCHHNYVAKETHYGQEVWVTRKGAVRAGKGELGIIPGSMGTRSYIVRGKGNPESFESCSHGAGRAMSRNEAKRRFTLDDHIRATEGIECRKDESVIDETPAAYKDIDTVMRAQEDLVEVVHTLRQVLCVKG
jgi:tRNA-splicing ligase RtcB (3'-phosphate/5'-hydroxy nucleic acid ligase)